MHLQIIKIGTVEKLGNRFWRKRNVLVNDRFENFDTLDLKVCVFQACIFLFYLHMCF